MTSRGILKILGTVLMAIAAAVASGAVTRTASAATTINVRVGGGSNGVTANGYFPGTVTVATGTTIHFSNPGLEPHTVTFMPGGPASAPPLLVQDPGGSPARGFNPVYANQSPASPATFSAAGTTNSGILVQPHLDAPAAIQAFAHSSYDITFPSSGSFTFFCAFHPMQMTVNVVSSGAVDSQASVDARAATESAATQNAGNTEAATLAAAPTVSTKNADGTTTWQIHVGGDATSSSNALDTSDIMQFFPPNLSIKQGDTVTWTNTQDVPHTVTFLSSGAVPPHHTLIPQKSGPPFFAFTAQAVFASGGNTYGGTGVVSSGFFGPGLPNPTTFSVKFTAAGAFPYICLLHADLGMMGTITVGAVSGASTSPSPTAPTGFTGPNTGTGPPARGSGTGMLYALAAFGAICGTTLVLAGRHARARRDGR